jgi:uncharacterized damage-inducible protein DinB
MINAKQKFLETYDTEHATTMRVLRAYPQDQLDLKPSDRSKTARELAWVFVLECRLGKRVWNDEIAQGKMSGKPPEAPASWSELLDTLERDAKDFRELVASASDEDLQYEVHFFTAPKTMGAITRLDWIWFLLHDQIHHRGQFSVYLRMAGGKLPSIYGPTADEPWV